MDSFHRVRKYGPFNPAKLSLLKIPFDHPLCSGSSLPSLFSISLLSYILPHSLARAVVIPRNLRTVVAAAAPVAGGSRDAAADTGHTDSDTASLHL